MSEAVLHDYWRSSACYRVRIVLNLKRVPYRAQAVDLTHGDQGEAGYLAINPQGLVPTLEIDGEVLTQSLAIADYLDAKVPDPPLVPRDPARRAQTLARALTIACDIHPLNNLRVLNTLRGAFNAGEDEVAAWVDGWIARGFAALEAEAPERGLFGGERPDLADVCLAPQMANARRFAVDLAPFRRLVRIDAALQQHEAFARAAPEAVRAGAGPRR